jgi:hypothetical protein
MTQNEIEHMWKVASNDPNHDSNWHDPVVIAFAKLVAMRTLEGTYDEMIDIVRKQEREACEKECQEQFDLAMSANEKAKLARDKNAYLNSAVGSRFCLLRIRARGEA